MERSATPWYQSRVSGLGFGRVVVLGLLSLSWPTLSTAQSVFTVVSTGGGADATPGDGLCADAAGECTLRAALDEANANGAALDSIHFNIPGPGPHVISLTNFPIVTQPVVIDGYTQPGASVNTNGPRMGTNAVLKIVLDGTGHFYGLQVHAGHSTVRGLVIHSTNNQHIELRGTHNVIEGNFIGTDETGKILLSPENGIAIAQTGDHNRIGGTLPASRNVIAALNIGVWANGVLGQDTIQGNFIGVDASGATTFSEAFTRGILLARPGTLVGGSTLGAGNVISGGGIGIMTTNATNVTIHGNLIGTDVSGTVLLGNTAIGIFMSAGPTFIGGSAPGEGNVISGNFTGINHSFLGKSFIRGNHIGTDITGTVAIPNTIGIELGGRDTAFVGGVLAGEANLISGNQGDGIQITTFWTNNIVQGNTIGTDINGGPLGNGGHGIQISIGDSNTVGGIDAAAANTIAFNGGAGVRIPSRAGNRNRIQRNRIYSNVGLGIDLETAGVNANDATDADAGSNNLQNYPDLTFAWGTTPTVVGTFTGAASTDLTIELYASATCDPTEFGEGETFLTAVDVTTDGSGMASFTAVSPVPVSIGDMIAATATDAAGNTSEFSRCVRVNEFAINALTVTTANDGDDGSCSVLHCTMREAILEANARTGADTIHFAIDGPGPHIVQPTSILPSITEPVFIDGHTQFGASPNTNPFPAAHNAVVMVAIDGTNAGAGRGLDFQTDSSTVRGLAISNYQTAVAFEGVGHALEGSFIDTDAMGTTPGAIAGGLVATVGPSRIGGQLPSQRNVIGGVVSLLGDSAVVQGNFIGVDATGMTPLRYDVSQDLPGPMVASASSHHLIGGSAAGEGNVIAGGLRLEMGASGLQVKGNFIGTDATASLDFDNPRPGIAIDAPGAGNSIGGTDLADRNVIAYNDSAGIYVIGGADQSLRGNAIFGNGGLGIDLDRDGLTLNDAGDVDAGANNLQNFPVLDHVVAGSAIVEGSLHSTPNTPFELDFYSNPTCDPAGYGQGALFLGMAAVVTDALGDAAFTMALSGDATPGETVTATATDPSGSTSEFSACATAVGFAVSAIAVDDSVILGGQATYDVTVSSLGGTFNRDVSLACSALPLGASCAFTPTVVQPGADTAMAVLTVTTSAASTPAGSQPFEVLASYASIQDTASASVTLAGFDVTVSQPSNTVTNGTPATTTVSVTAHGGAFDALVTLACSQLEPGLTCSFSPSSVTPGLGTATSTLSVSQASSAASSVSRTSSVAEWIDVRWTVVFMVIGLLGFGLKWSAIYRRLRIWSVIAPLILVLIVLGCGSDPTAPTVSKTFVVTATSGAVTDSVSVTVSVQ